jgi:hypothetical protein
MATDREQDRETQRILAIKGGLIQMTSGPGWVYFQGMAKNAVDRAIDEALAEEDPVKGESKRLKARALQKGLADLFSAVETTKQMNLQPGDDGSGFDLDPFLVGQVTADLDL